MQIWIRDDFGVMEVLGNRICGWGWGENFWVWKNLDRILEGGVWDWWRDDGIVLS